VPPDRSNPFENIRYVFLDREGILNLKPPEGNYVTSWEQFHLLPGVQQAIAKLNHAGLMVIVVTNQRGIALGRMTQADLDDIHRRLREELAQSNARLDGIYVCPHDIGLCRCRKPEIGLFQQGFADFPGARPENSVMIGDSLSDIEAGIRVGMPTIFVPGDPATQKAGAEHAARLATTIADSLADAVDRYLLTADNVSE
jgi:D-glycero-D-manno-heptose 1,7-bisphosphate phosphatase